jgi:hypothetical protein
MFLQPPLFAFGIAHLPMLGWMAAAAAPLVIHLLTRRKYRETTWAAMEYLLAAMKRQSRKIQIEQWLLLAIRTLLVVLVVLAVAEPFVERPGLALSPGGHTHRVLVFDGSYSMACKPTDKSRFEQAKELASRIVDESSPGDAFTMILMASPPRVVVATPAFEPSQIRAEIENLELVHTGADLPATVAEARKLVEKVRQESPRLQNHEVCFLTDLQRATWAPNLDEAAMAEFSRQTSALAKLAGLTVYDLGQPAPENLAITSLRAADSPPIVGRNVEFTAEIKDFSDRGRPRQSVGLWVDGRQAARQDVEVPAGGTSPPVRFNYRFETPGDHAVEARAEGDALDVDNHRYLVVPVRQSLRILCIDGRPAGEPFRGAADYLAAALASEAEPSEHPLVDVEVAAESSLQERDLGVYDCVFLSDVAQFTTSEARVLDAYLGHGGNLVFFLGEQVSADHYNRELGDAGGRKILPAELGKVVTERQATVDPLGYAHPIVQVFRGRDKAGLLTTPISKHFKLNVPKGSTAKVALAAANGDPLIVTDTIRRGRVVLVATSADTSWTPMPVWASYVPLVHEILAWCVGGQSQQHNVTVGEPIEESAMAGAGEGPVSIERPDGQTRSVPLRTDGDYGGWSYDETYRSGIYTARVGRPPSRSWSFAVNVNTAESDLAPIAVEELPFGIFSYQPTWQATDARTAGPIARPGRLHVELLYAVLGLLFLESFLAWRFGHHAV